MQKKDVDSVIDFDWRRQDLALDEAMIESFPDSDPVAMNCTT